MRWIVISAVATIVVIAGSAGLFVPVSVGHEGGMTACGNAVFPDLSAAEAVDQANEVGASFDPSGAVTECEDSLSWRRLWALPAIAIGLATLVAWVPRKRREANLANEAEGPTA